MTFKNLPAKYAGHVGIGLEYEGRTREIFGVSGTGYGNGFETIEVSDAGERKVKAPFTRMMSPPIAGNDIGYLTGSGSKGDVKLAVYVNGKRTLLLKAP